MSNEFYERAEHCNEKDNLAQAIEEYTQSIRHYPDFEDAYIKRGVAYARLGQFEKGLGDLDYGISLSPDNIGAYSDRGLCRYYWGDLKGAFEDFEYVLSRDNEFHAPALTNRAQARAHIDDYHGAVDDISNAMQLVPNDFRLYTNRAAMYIKMELYDKAITDLNHALKLNPDDLGAYMNRGIAKLRNNDFDGALNDFSVVLEHNPKNQKALMNKLNVRAQLHEFHAAIEDARHDFSKYAQVENKSKNYAYGTLYSFRSISDYSKNEILENKLHLANPNTFNDPFDCPILESFRNLNALKLDEFLRVRCFVYSEDVLQQQTTPEPLTSILHWSHYGGYHKGMVIGYKLDTSFKDTECMFLSGVRYSDRVNYDLPEFRSETPNFWGTGLLTKNACWAYENEHRLVAFAQESCGQDGMLLDIDELMSIESITFGFKTPESDKKEVFNLLNEEQRKYVRFYEMQKDDHKGFFGLKRVLYLKTDG